VTDAAKIWLLRLFALVIAIVLWLVVSYVPRLEERREPLIEREIVATLGYQVPERYLLLKRDHEVRVRVRGRAEAVRRLGAQDVDLQVPFPSEPSLERPNQVLLRREDVTVPEGVEVASISPNTLSLVVDERETRMLEVVPDLQGEPSAGARVEGYEVTPPQVLVEGPKRGLEALSRVYTEPIRLESHALTFTEQVEVRSEDPSVRVLQPTLVAVRIDMIAPAPTQQPGGGR
jgi:YbbR domain-containing protein